MKILLVEDTRSVAMLMKVCLTRYGYEVIHAENGKSAIEMFQSSAPDLVLMDINMPEMNGYEATSHIRAFEATKEWAWTPIIFLTADDSVESFITAIEAGGDDLMVKNTPEPVLQAKMKAMSRIAALRQRLAFANNKLEEFANRDSLTGLFNRRYMDMVVDGTWATATRQGKPYGLLMLDIDNFKKYNDTYGHQAGDKCLQQFASAIAPIIKAANTQGLSQMAHVSRYGGEEFLVSLPDVTMEAYEKVAAAINNETRKLNIPHEKNDDWGIVTVSIGGARMDPANGKVATLFHAADKNLYKAKNNGRNRAELI